MRKVLFLLFLFAISVSCSDDDVSVDKDLETENFFNFEVNGTTIPMDNNPHNFANIVFVNGIFHVSVAYGFGIYDSAGLNRFSFSFLEDGTFLEAKQESMDVSQNSFAINYKNFYHFPSNYFSLNVISIDKENQKISATFSGRLYMDRYNLESEFIEIEGDFEQRYETSAGSGPLLEINGVEQYCKAKFNGTPWEALWEYPLSTFTAEDAYKIEINFASDALSGSYEVNPASNENYIKFSKFNTETKVFDTYIVNGVLSHSYREFHGNSRYSYIGTFSFTAINSTNPSDVVNVSEGVFRSYQQF